jgi:hypothetical protein
MLLPDMGCQGFDELIFESILTGGSGAGDSANVNEADIVFMLFIWVPFRCLSLLNVIYHFTSTLSFRQYHILSRVTQLYFNYLNLLDMRKYHSQ